MLVVSFTVVVSLPYDDELYSMDIMYINLDNKTQRRHDFLAAFEKYCSKERSTGSLHRIRGVNGSDADELDKYLDCDIATLPGLVELAPGEKEWDTVSKRPQWSTGPMWRGAIGCALAHLSAALKVVELGVDYALVLEDDMTLELLPYWPRGAFQSTIAQLPVGWEAVQLSLICGPEVWDKLQTYAMQKQAFYVTYSNIWLASNGAYLLSRDGAKALLNRFYNEKTLKFDLSSLMCANSDICMLPLLTSKFLRYPPMFMHKHVDLAALDSDIAGLQQEESEIQVSATQDSRENSMMWAKYSFDRHKAAGGGEL
jgi:GR25 family glycosyltransferase involved in LPS biosynthesis